MKETSKTVKTQDHSIFLCLSALLLLLFAVQFESVVVRAKKMPSALSNLSVEFFYTCDGEIKANRYFTMEARIKNLGEDFVGKLQVVFPEAADANSIAIETPVSVKKGEEKSQKITMYMDSAVPFIKAQVITPDKTVVAEQKKNLVLEEKSDTLYIGTLSNTPESLRYLGEFYQACVSAKNFSLAERPLPEDAKEYDMYDVIVVNDYDLTLLTGKQKGALKKWVEDGGSFVLGADSYFDKNRSFFSEDLVIQKIGETRRDISIQGASVLQADDEGILLQEVLYGKGVVQVAGIDLALNPANWRGIGNGILTLIKENRSNSKVVQMKKESYGSAYYPVYKSIGFKEKQINYPVVNYMVVYFLYLVIIGPVLYFVLKKKDRKELLWVLVPLMSVLFTIIIYVMGSSTRIRDTNVSYFSTLTMDAAGKGEQETIFMAESSENDPYRLAADKDAQLMPIICGSSPVKDQDVSKNFKMLVEMNEDQTICNMNEYASFEAAYFRSDQQIQRTDQKGNYYQSDLTYKQGKMEGTVTTHLGYDLENACILTGNTVTALGTVKDGVLLQVGNQKSQSVHSQLDLYADQSQDGSILQEITGYDMSYLPQNDEEHENYYRFQLLSYYMEQNLHTADSYLIGFSNKPESHVIQKEGICLEGENLVVLPLQAANTKEDLTVFTSLDSYKTIKKGRWDVGDRLIHSNELYVLYALPEDMRVSKIQYLEQFNGKFETQRGNGFFGKILFYNNETHRYDGIFTGAKEGILMEPDDYVNQYNQIKVLYRQDADKPGTLPILSAAAEGRNNADN